MGEISNILDNENQSLRKIEKDASLTLGQYGAVYQSGVTLVTGNFGCISAIEDSVFQTLVSSNWTGSALSGLPLKAGITIFGDFTSFQLTSGKVVAYNNQAV